MGAGWAGGSTRRWRRTRAAVLERNRQANGGRCALNVGDRCPKHGRACPGVCTGVAEQVHHTRGKRSGDDPRYLEASCAACNVHVGDPAAAADPAPAPRTSW